MFEDPKTGKPMLLGAISIEELQQEPFAEWYQMESDGYEVDTELTNAISDQDNTLTKFSLVLGVEIVEEKCLG
jgi:hypothetical protein